MPRMLSFEELREHGVLYSRRWLEELEARGKFPSRVRIGERRVGWIESEVVQHMQAKLVGRPSFKPRQRRQRVLQKKKAG